MGLVLEGDFIDLHKSESHGFIFDYNVVTSYFGVRNRPIELNTDITIQDQEKRMRTVVELSECMRCRYLESKKDPHKCSDKPKVEIIV